MSIVFAMPPSKQSISHIWNTGIQKAISGVEKRSALFTWYRISTECDYITGVNSESVWIRNRFKKDITDPWYIPLFPDRTTITGNLGVGETTIPCADLTYRHFIEGEKALIVDNTDWKTYELITIDTIAGNNITINSPGLVSACNAGFYIYPVFECRIQAAQELTKQFRYVDRFKITFIQLFE